MCRPWSGRTRSEGRDRLLGPQQDTGGVNSAGNVVTAANPTAYSQLIMAAQSQAIAAGVPFDILTESDLTNLSKVVNYDAIIFPSFANVQQSKLSAIEEVLTKAVYNYGVSLVAAGNFMTNDETGTAFPDTSPGWSSCSA